VSSSAAIRRIGQVAAEEALKARAGNAEGCMEFMIEFETAGFSVTPAQKCGQVERAFMR
jgi:hypothetical protein